MKVLTGTPITNLGPLHAAVYFNTYHVHSLHHAQIVVDKVLDRARMSGFGGKKQGDAVSMLQSGL